MTSFYLFSLLFTLAFCLSLNGGNVVLKSAAENQINIEVTVYNNNLGLIKDVREITLPKGEGELRFMDVAAYILPATVHVKSLNRPDEFEVLEQNYEYDLISRFKLLKKYVGKEVKILDRNEYLGKQEFVKALLISNNDGNLIFKINGEIYLGYPGEIILPKIPEDLIARPTLTWLYRNDSQKSHTIEVSYLTKSLNWNADYVLILNKNDTQAEITGWVTVENTSGATYRNAKLKLIAGEVNRAEREDYIFKGRYSRARKSQFKEKEFFEYHIYDLQRKTTIKDNQTRQIQLLEANGFKIKKEYFIYGAQGYFTSAYEEKIPKLDVNTFLIFKNSSQNHLGMPFPAGVIRVYKKDSRGSLQFIGEDDIPHTPRDEDIRIKVGKAFDIIAERKQTYFKEVSPDTIETEWEINLRNHKKTDITVTLIEPVGYDWEIISSTHPYVKEDIHTLRFDIPVKRDREVKLRYRARIIL